MSKLTHVRSSSVQYDGTAILQQQSGILAFSAGVQSNLAPFVAPGDLYIKSVVLTVLTTTSNAGAILNIGSPADDDSRLDAFVIQNLAAGTYEISGSSLWTPNGKKVTKGDVVTFKLDAASAAGTFAVAIIYVPLIQETTD